MKPLPRYLRIASLCFLAVFLVQCVTRIVSYDAMLTAVPLWMFLALYALSSLLPALLLFAASVVLAKKRGPKT